MYDFSNLSDTEFEKLSSDILSRKLGVKLRYFAPGRDGGIDLKDDKDTIVVQVKHYYKSNFNSLKRSLRKEVEKVRKINPKQYYVCISKELTPQNVADIYELFKDYMSDTSNIITKVELVDFLNDDTNQDILRKNFKLWLLSDKLLKDIFNNNVFIDGEVLLDDINEEFKFFVETNVFNEALEILKKQRLLMLYGAPGVGKSITSKMLAAAFVKEDYIIRYTTDGNVSNLKRVISENPDVKEVILLDDCLGQYYFNLKKGQDRELITLIKYIRQKRNKILILNTRVTLLNEAKRSSFEFRDFLEQDKIVLKTIDMGQITRGEKAEIFYNHLKRNQLPKVYFEALKEERKYDKIISHTNYNPRIIEFVTKKYRYSEIISGDYYEYIMRNLSDPKEVWADEIEEKLKEVDRIYMHTLFSLTDTYIESEALKKCFNYRLENEKLGISTIDIFANVQKRLSKSLVRIFDVNGVEKVGVLNPSINDYMNNSVKKNENGLNAIRKSILYIEQIEKMYEKEQVEEIIISKLDSEEFTDMECLDNKKTYYFYYGITKKNILKESYKEPVKNGFGMLIQKMELNKINFEKTEIIAKFIQNKNLYNFYEIGESLQDEDFLDSLIKYLDFNDIAKIMLLLEKEGFLTAALKERLYDNIIDELDYYLNSIDIEEWMEENDSYYYFSQSINRRGPQEKFDDLFKVICTELNLHIKTKIKEQIESEFIYELISEDLESMIEDIITENGVEKALDQYFNQEPDYEDFYDQNDDRRSGYEKESIDITDIIFNREFDE